MGEAQQGFDVLARTDVVAGVRKVGGGDFHDRILVLGQQAGAVVMDDRAAVGVLVTRQQVLEEVFHRGNNLLGNQAHQQLIGTAHGIGSAAWSGDAAVAGLGHLTDEHARGKA